MVADKEVLCNSRKRRLHQKNCSVKGKEYITLEDVVTVRPYAQIWVGYCKNCERL